MKAQILKIAGVKNEKEFYKKFPTEEAFLKKHGKELEKASDGIRKKFTTPKMTYQPLDMSLTGAMTKNPYMTGKAALDDSVDTADVTTDGNSAVTSLLSNLPSLVGAFQDIGETRKDINNLKAYGEIGDIVARAAATRPEKRQRKIDYNAMRSQTVNPLGVGTNYLQAEDGAEIQNTFAPNAIYTDLGYEPLNDSTRVKQFAFGGEMSPMLQGLAGNIGSAIGKGTGRGGSWSQIGSVAGTAASLIPGIGTAVGLGLKFGLPLIGGLIDADGQNEEQMAIDKLTASTNAASFQSGMQGFFGQNSAVAEDGGWVSNDWQPQTITKFGDYSMDQLLAPPHDADMLRAGGHLQSYTPPSARAMYTGKAEYGSQMAFGGDVQVGNGYMRPLSDDVQELVGPSHENGGMPFSNGHNLIEAEGKETVMKTYGDGGPTDDGSVTIFGNRIINKDAADFVGIKPGRKYKIESKDLALKQDKFEKKATKNFASANDMQVDDMFSQIEQRTKLLNGQAFTTKAAEIKDQLQNLAIYQNETGDAAEALGLEINAFDKGIAKPVKESNMAKFGAKMETAATGKKVKYDPEFENFIDQAMQLEQANSLQAGDYRGGGSYFGTNNPALTSPEKAKEYYYKNYWSKVKDLPAGLRTRALQMAINTGDPYGELMVAAGKMSVADRAATKGQRKDKAITGNKDWEKSKADIIKAYKEDPQAFLGKLDAEQSRYYTSLNANNDFGINKDTAAEFFDDYVGLARYASQPYIPTNQAATNTASPTPAPVPTEYTAIPGAAPAKTPISPLSIGDLSKAERKAMAIANGIKNYTGTAAQNKKLMSIVNESASNPIMAPGTGVMANAPLPQFNMFAGINPTTPYTLPNQQPTVGRTIPKGFSPEGQLEKPSPFEGAVTLSSIAEANAPMPVTLYNKDKELDDVAVYSEKEEPVLEPPAGTIVENFGAKSDPRNQKKKGNTDWMNTGLATLNSLIPFYNQGAQRPLNPDQLIPEYMALAMNQLEPVQAQLYNPMLQAQPYRVSLQDQRNEVIAQQRAAERMAYGNPAAAAMIASQASNALNKINAEEFRANQSETMRAAEANRAQMNEAQRVNLGILDQQYARQSEAQSKTKTQALEVAKSFAQKNAEQRKINNREAILRNMYPGFSFTKSGVAYKNPLYTAMFNVPDVGTGAESKEDITSPTNLFKNEETTKSKTTKRNGGIVKAIKNL